MIDFFSMILPRIAILLDSVGIVSAFLIKLLIETYRGHISDRHSTPVQLFMSKSCEVLL